MSNDRRLSDVPSASFKFTSARATPKDARQNRGRNEGEDRGYDSYKPGQSPSRDMLPGPVRTSSTQNPFPLNDARRPGSPRPPSDSSPRHFPSRPSTSRTNSNTEQLSRDPEVGIRILGIAAQADKERKQREEDAKRYMMNAKNAQKNSKVMEDVQGNAAPEASTALGLNDKVKATEAPIPEQALASARNNSATQTVQLAVAIRTMIDEVSEVAALKIRRNTTKAKLDKAKSDIERSKSHHAGFPSIKETLTQAKKAADQLYQKADKHLEDKDKSLNDLAERVAEQVIPSIVGESVSALQQQKEQEKDDRIAALERTCQNFNEIFMTQKNFWEEHKKDKEKLEQEQKAVTEELRLYRAEAAKEKIRTDKLFAKQSEFAMATKTISSQVSELKESVTEVSNTILAKQVPIDLNQQLSKVQAIDTLRKKLEKLEMTAKTSLANMTTTVVNLSGSVDMLKDKSEVNSNMAKTFTQEQFKLRNDVTAIGDRIGAIATKHSDAELAKKNATDAENVTQNATTKLAADQVTSRLATIEQWLKSLTSKTNTLEELTTSVQTDSARLGNLENSTTQVDTIEAGQGQLLINDVNAIKRRLDVLESQQPQSVPATSSTNFNQKYSAQKTENGVPENNSSSNDLYVALSSEVLQLKADLASQQGELEDLVGFTGDTIKDIVGAEISKFTPRLDAIEANTQTMETSLENIGASVTNLEDRVKDQDKAIMDAKNSMVGAAAGSVIDIIRSQNIFAPASLDEKFIYKLNGVNNALMEHVEAHALAISSVQSRMDNLSTGDLHAAMVNHLNTTYPSLRKSETNFQIQGSQIVALHSKIDSVQKMVEEVQTRESKQASLSAPSPVPVPDPPKQDDALLKALVSKLDAMAQTVAKVQENLEQVATNHTAHKEQTTTELTEIKHQTSILSEEFATNIFAIKTSDEELNTQITSLAEKIEAVDKRVDGLAASQHKIEAPSAPPSTGQISNKAFSTVPTRGSSMPGNRATSVASDASGSNRPSKKRSHGDSTKALVEAFVNGPRKRSNGVQNGQLSGGSGSPKLNPYKRLRTAGGTKKKVVEDDSDQDPDCDVGDANAGISADEDEDLLASSKIKKEMMQETIEEPKQDKKNITKRPSIVIDIDSD